MAEDLRSLEYTLTWILAGVCFVIVFISFGVERLIHRLRKPLKRKDQDALYEALLKLIEGQPLKRKDQVPLPEALLKLNEGKSEWPELVGVQGNIAARTIERENRNVDAQVIPEDGFFTADYRSNRVRVRVDDRGIVSSTPFIG